MRKDDRYYAALRAHYQREIELFGLSPADKAPVFVDTDNPPAASDHSAQAASWRRAAAWRAELLKANPKHYDDIFSLKGKKL